MTLFSRLPGFFILLCSLCAVQLSAQENRWTQTNGPEGGRVTAIAVTPAGTIVVTMARTYRSVDGGRSWIRVTGFPRDRQSDLFAAGLAAVGVDSTGNPIGIFNSSLVRSTDEGITWTRIDSVNHPLNGNSALAVGVDNAVHLLANGSVNRLRTGRTSSITLGASSFANRAQAISIGTDGSLFVGTAGARLHRSLDRGDSWSLLGVGAGDSTSTMRAVEMLPDGRLLVGTSIGLFQSSDGGGTWQRDSGTPGIHPINSILREGATIHVGTTGAGLFVSRDAGLTWDPTGAGLDVPDVWSLARGRGDTLYAGTSRGFHISADRGSTWRESSSGMIATFIHNILVDPNNELYATTETGIFHSSDRGDSWTRVDHPLVYRSIGYLVIDSSDALIAVTADATLLRSTDRGIAWTETGRMRLSRWPRQLVVGPRGDYFMAAGPDGDFVGGVLRSTDRGENWELVYDGVDASNIAISSTGSMFFTARGDGIYRSRDNGLNWQKVTNGPTESRRTFGTLVADANRGLYVFDGHYWFWRSLDDGDTWEYLWTLEPDLSGDMVVGSNGHLLATMYGEDVYNSAGLVLSTDRGTTWRDAGWTGLDEDGWNSYIRPTAAADGIYYAGTFHGVMRSSRLRSDAPVPPAEPAGIALHQNTPNPFGTASTIRFDLPAAADVRLSLVDMLGNEVAVLYDGHAAEGAHELTIERADLPSGVYGCRLESGGVVLLRRMVIVE